MIIHQVTGCPDHDDCIAATKERATSADVDEDGIVTYSGYCAESGAVWNSACDEEVSRLVLASTLRDYQQGRRLDGSGNVFHQPLSALLPSVQHQPIADEASITEDLPDNASWH